MLAFPFNTYIIFIVHSEIQKVTKIKSFVLLRHSICFISAYWTSEWMSCSSQSCHLHLTALLTGSSVQRMHLLAQTQHTSGFLHTCSWESTKKAFPLSRTEGSSGLNLSIESFLENSWQNGYSWDHFFSLTFSNAMSDTGHAFPAVLITVYFPRCPWGKHKNVVIGALL